MDVWKEYVMRVHLWKEYKTNQMACMPEGDIDYSSQHIPFNHANGGWFYFYYPALHKRTGNMLQDDI